MSVADIHADLADDTEPVGYAASGPPGRRTIEPDLDVGHQRTFAYGTQSGDTVPDDNPAPQPSAPLWRVHITLPIGLSGSWTVQAPTEWAARHIAFAEFLDRVPAQLWPHARRTAVIRAVLAVNKGKATVPGWHHRELVA